jgi:hypothetical protein
VCSKHTMLEPHAWTTHTCKYSTGLHLPAKLLMPALCCIMVLFRLLSTP